MNETFKQVFGIAPWTVTDEGITFKGKNIPYGEIQNFRLLTAPTALTQGVIQFPHNGKIITVAYTFKDRERVTQAVQFVKSKIDSANGIVKNYKFLLHAHTGSTLEVYDTYMILDFMSLNAMSNIAKGGANGGKKINIRDITSVQFKEPAGVAVGFIQFEYPGSLGNKQGVVSALQDENSIPVSPQNLEIARQIVDYIEKKRDELATNSNATIVNQVSSADELVKFKGLLDSGVITQEEFDAKKKQLLGL